MEGPPPARAPLGRPTLLTDLPVDVLAYHPVLHSV
jgi:hypothetical protein